MTFRFTQSLGTALVLAVMLMLVILAYQNSNKTINFLSLVVEVHTPVLDSFNEISRLMSKADNNIRVYKNMNELKMNELSEIISRININVKLIYANINYGDRSLLRMISEANSILKNMGYAKSKITIHNNIDILKDKLLELKVSIRKLYQSLSQKEKSTIIDYIKVISNLNNSLNSYLNNYTQQSTVLLDDIISPLKLMKVEINNIMSFISDERYSHSHKEVHYDIHGEYNSENEYKHDAGLKKSLVELNGIVNRFIQSIHIYSEEKKRMDPSASKVADTLTTVFKIKHSLINEIFSIHELYRKHVTEDQAALVEQSKDSRRNFVVFYFVGLLLGIIGIVVINKIVRKDLAALIGGTHEFAKSNFKSRISTLKLKEFNELSESFNQISEYVEYNNSALRKNMEDLDHANDIISNAKNELEQQVEERTGDLKLAMEAAKKSDLAKSAFLANMSHELRTPLHGILSFAKFGLDKTGVVTEERVKGYFSQIDASGHRLKVLLDDLLDLSKLEAGKMQLSFSKIKFFDVVNECVAEQNALLLSHHLKVELIISDDFPLIECDRNRMGQVVMNILSNAIKFSPDGGTITIEGKIFKASQGENNECESVQISITDQGEGIPESDLNTIFEKFVQSDGNDPSSGGTGLGLAITKELMLAHHGRVWCENIDSGGATFYFTLPIEQSQG